MLACCLQSKVARDRARAALSSSDFYVPVHEELWDLMNRADRQGMAVDSVSMFALVRQDEPKVRVLIDLGGYPVVPESVDTHAAVVRKLAVKRQMYGELLHLQQKILNPDTDALGLADGAAKRLLAIRDDHRLVEDIEAMTVEELILEVDEEPDWLIPGFLERGDRFLLTGEEGLGKSHLLRQIVVLSSAGLDPFTQRPIEPVRGMIIDFENSVRQIRRRLYSTYQFAVRRGRGAPGLATVLSMPRSDITLDKTLNKLHRELDACQPEVLAIGPLYKMSPKALQTDDEAGPVLAALDSIRERGIALLIEAHAGHVKGSHGKRDLRPRGSSALLGWPEFGYGMQRASDASAALIPWRGDRDARTFPTHLVESGDGLWVEERARTVHEFWQRQDWSGLEEEGVDEEGVDEEGGDEEGGDD